MKKLLSFAAIAVMALTLSSCGKPSEKDQILALISDTVAQVNKAATAKPAEVSEKIAKIQEQFTSKFDGYNDAIMAMSHSDKEDIANGLDDLSKALTKASGDDNGVSQQRQDACDAFNGTVISMQLYYTSMPD